MLLHELLLLLPPFFNLVSTTSILSWGDCFLSTLVPTRISLWILTTPLPCNTSCISPIKFITSFHGPAIVVPALCKVQSRCDSLANFVIVVTSLDTDALLVPICLLVLVNFYHPSFARIRTGIKQTSARQCNLGAILFQLPSSAIQL